jgi:hypothetical protein
MYQCISGVALSHYACGLGGVGLWVWGLCSTHILWPSLLRCRLMWCCWWYYHWMLLIPVILDVPALVLHYATTGVCACRGTSCLFAVGRFGGLGCNCFLNGLVVVVGGAAFLGLCQTPCWGYLCGCHLDGC